MRPSAGLALLALVWRACGASAGSNADPGALLPPTAQKMMAVVAASEELSTATKAAQLGRLGFDLRRVDPVYQTKEENAARNCGLSPKQAGVFSAHVSMWRQVANQSMKALLLEDDWSIGPQDEAQVAATLRAIEARTEDWQLIGHCYGTACSTAYYLTPRAAQRLLNNMDPCRVGECPLDWYLESLHCAGELSAYFSPKQAPFGRTASGEVDTTQDGLIQQDETQQHAERRPPATSLSLGACAPHASCSCAVTAFKGGPNAQLNC